MGKIEFYYVYNNINIIMLACNDPIDILKELPYELVEHVAGYLSSIDMVNFINKTDVYINIKSINISDEELIIYNLLEEDNKLYKWCKILYNADYIKYYKNKHKKKTNSELKLPTSADNKYIFKLKMGLLLNADDDFISLRPAAKLDFDIISIIYNTIKNYPKQFEVWYLIDIIKNLKEDYDYDTYIKTAKRLAQIRSMKRYCEKKDYKTLGTLPDINYQRIIHIINEGTTFQSALRLSKNFETYPDELIEKFIQLKQELGYGDSIILSNLKNDKMINHLKIFKNIGFSDVCVNHLLDLKLPMINYLVKNNYLDKFKEATFGQMNDLYQRNNDIIKQFFIKFTIKQQNNLRIKQLMEDGDYDKLLISYIEVNINNVTEFFYQQHFNRTSYSVSVEQYFNAYTELTETQFKKFLKKITTGTNYATALAEAYQITEY